MGTTSDIAFEHLKYVLSCNHVLALLDYSIPFTLEYDASGKQIGVVLMWDGHPIAFFSKALSPKYLGMSTYERIICGCQGCE